MKSKIFMLIFTLTPFMGGCANAVAGRDSTLSKVLSATIADNVKDSKNIHKILFSKTSGTEYQISAILKKNIMSVDLEVPTQDYHGEISISSNTKSGLKSRFKANAFDGTIEGGEIFYPSKDKYLSEHFEALGKGTKVGDETFHYYSGIMDDTQQALWYDLYKNAQEDILKVIKQK